MCGKARVGGQHHIQQRRCRGKTDILEETWGQRSTPVTDRSRAPGSSCSNDRPRKELRRLSVWSVDGGDSPGSPVLRRSGFSFSHVLQRISWKVHLGQRVLCGALRPGRMCLDSVPRGVHQSLVWLSEWGWFQSCDPDYGEWTVRSQARSLQMAAQ